MTIQQAKEKIGEILEKVRAIGYSISLIHWDMATLAPEKSVDFSAKNIGLLDAEIFKLVTSDEIKECIDILISNEEGLDLITKKVVEEASRIYDRLTKIPADEYRAYSELTAKAQSVWQVAKRDSDFSKFAPYLEKIVTYKRNYAKYIGYKDHPYNALLDEYEPGMTVLKLDNFFGAIKDGLVPLIKKIQTSGITIDKSSITKSYPVDKQAEFSKYILELMGFDMDAGVVAVSEHPFTCGIHKSNVRLTSHYYENNFTSGMFSSIHEGGHGLYEQNIGDDIADTILGEGTSLAIHESQSRMYENMFGRSSSFLSFIFPKFKELYPEQFANVNIDEVYKAINESKTSLIRIESDEVTYSLHIIVRYEIEKLLIEGKVEVCDLPQLWKEKMKEYLGVEPNNDAEGVLQDVHWSEGIIGYFPSYALGNAIAAQLVSEMSKTINVDSELKRGDFLKITNWLKEGIHKYGKLKDTEELIKDLTGEELNPRYYIEYLVDKYSDIYGL